MIFGFVKFSADVATEGIHVEKKTRNRLYFIGIYFWMRGITEKSKACFALFTLIHEAVAGDSH